MIFCPYTSLDLTQNLYKNNNSAISITGAVLVPPAALGHIFAGIVINRMRWRIPGILKFSSVSLLIAAALGFVGLINCDNAPVAGVAVPYTCVYSYALLVWYIEHTSKMNSIRK